jgi:hypothetical protein
MKNKDKIRLSSVAQYGLTIFGKKLIYKNHNINEELQSTFAYVVHNTKLFLCTGTELCGNPIR